MQILLGLALVMLIAACEGRLDGDPGEVAEPPAAEDPIPAALLPRFTPAGELIRPEGWETWVLAGTSMGLTYTESATAPAPAQARSPHHGSVTCAS